MYTRYFLGKVDIPYILFFFLVNTRCWGPTYVADKIHRRGVAPVGAAVWYKQTCIRLSTDTKIIHEPRHEG